MIFLCCIYKCGNFKIYNYWNSDNGLFVHNDRLVDCANVQSGRGLGFDLKDVVVTLTQPSIEFAVPSTTIKYLVLEEYKDNTNKVKNFGVFDFTNLTTKVIDTDVVLSFSNMVNVLNYSFVVTSETKYLRKKPNSVVCIRDVRMLDFAKDTHQHMSVKELRYLLELRGMRVGASCVTGFEDRWDGFQSIIDDFYFKDSSILRLSYNANPKDEFDTRLSYYAGDLFLLSALDMPRDVFNCGWSGGTSKNYVGYDRLWGVSHDIRDNLFKFYDGFKDNLLPAFTYQLVNDNSRKVFSTYFMVNLVTERQGDLNSIYMDDDSHSDITFYTLFHLLSFKYNIRYFSGDFKKVLKPCIDVLDDVLKDECVKMRKSEKFSKSSIQKAINWCNETLRGMDMKWKTIK